MHRLTNQIFVYLGFLASIFLGIFFLETVPFFITMLIVMAVMGVITMLVRTMYSFAILITFILIIAFYNVGISWFMQWDMKQQGVNIGTQSLFSFAALMAWMSGYAIQKNQETLISLNTELALLRKYEEYTGLLTFNEFIEQAQILFTGMKRRKEHGFLVYIGIKENTPFKQRILKEKLTSVLLTSIRTKFDLVGQLTPVKLILFLNNTTEDGVEIVINRIKENLQQENLEDGEFSFTVEAVADLWEVVIQRIQLRQTEEDAP
ncbi:GGDEF domain-containing protein [Robertmurraya sp. DFI.2.37]|uniref:GGDEF domain-containing protein n=1 Tax=Robertmurraya sp. DFI.2.37 TaxID=3031819 RepID=UPI001247A6EE|nr:GGDEF domain-containing protein [Robertmurraya sp. DFI.2.37]MDF1507039.1 GGDEF domain-containing protein [Robertmurraya sp. DFI.2.37]